MCFLFSVGDESGEFYELDGARKFCGYVYGGDIQEHFSNLGYGLSEIVGTSGSAK